MPPSLKIMSDPFGKNKLVIYEFKNNPIVTLGAPHQVPLGKNAICKPKRNGDTNSGILALAIFDELRKLDIPCKLIIKSRATGVDPNKSIKSDYSKEVFRVKSKMLFEIHGQSSRNNVPLEFSAGKNDLSRISKLGLFFYEEIRQLQKRGLINYIYSFGIQEKKDSEEAILFLEDGQVHCGELVLPALKSVLLDEVENYNMSAIHLEAMPQFRFDMNGNLPKDGKYLAKVIANSIYKYFYDSSFKD